MANRCTLTVVLLCQWIGVVAAGCISSTNELVVEESKVTDLGSTREYILCEDTVFSIGFLDFFGHPESGGSDIFPLRPNMHIKCGATGSRSNNCLVQSGDVQMEGTTLFGAPGDSLDNVVITGITFSDAQKHIVWINKPGDILFEDCEFRNNTKAQSPLFFDYFNESSTDELSVTFRRCDFVDNAYAGLPSQPALVIGNSQQNRISFIQCNFERNDMVTSNPIAERNSFLVETTGPLDLVRNCFTENVLGVAPVAVYGAELIVNSNYQSNSTGRRCALAAKFTTGSFYDNFSPLCTVFDASECQSKLSEAPTMSPTSSLAEVSSLSPTTVDSVKTESTQKPTDNKTGGSGSEKPPVAQGRSQAFTKNQLGFLAHIVAYALFAVELF